MQSKTLHSLVLATALIGVTVVPTSSRGQGVDSAAVALARPMSNVKSGARQPNGAVISPAGATRAMALAPVAIPAANAFSDFESVGRPKAQMGVGLAAVVLGIIIGGDVGAIFMVGGSVLGLIGLYHYMR